MSDLVVSGPTLLPNREIADATIRIQKGVIERISPGRDAGADLTITDGCIAPGWIDLQVNGAFGLDLTTDASTALQVAAQLPATGVTAFLPTVISTPFEAYPKLLHDLQEARHDGSHLHAQILGAHLEGPYLNPIRRGAHNSALLRAIDLAEITRWADPSIVRLVTLAPELPGALEAVKELRRTGIAVSAGHSNATYVQALAGFEAGISWGTHLFNAMSPLEHREPGLAGALLSSSIPCGLIADAIHAHPAVVKLAYRAKGADGLTLVTDAMAATMMPPGRYMLGDRQVIVNENSARLADGTLAGSILTLDQAVRNTIAFTGCSLAEALTMASTTPARVLGLARKDRVAPGCDADLVILNERLEVTYTFVSGHLAYEKQEKHGASLSGSL